MDALEMAKQALGEFEKAASKEKRPPTIEVFAQRAFVSAAVAQAEQLKRIADCLNAMAGTTAGIEDALYGIARKDEGTWAVVDGLNQRID